jgi:hypothetical protein
VKPAFWNGLRHPPLRKVMPSKETSLDLRWELDDLRGEVDVYFLTKSAS